MLLERFDGGDRLPYFCPSQDAARTCVHVQSRERPHRTDPTGLLSHNQYEEHVALFKTQVGDSLSARTKTLDVGQSVLLPIYHKINFQLLVP